MTPMAFETLSSAIKESKRLFGKLQVYMEKIKKEDLLPQEKEQLKALGEEIFLFEEQYHRKSVSDTLLILSPLSHTLSMLVRALLLGKGVGSLMFTLAIAFLKENDKERGTRLLGPAFEEIARKCAALLTATFFQKLTSTERIFLEHLILLYLGLSMSLGKLALGVEKEEALLESEEEIKKRVALSKEIALVYTPLFLQLLLKQELIELSIKETGSETPYGVNMESAPRVISGILEFLFLGYFTLSVHRDHEVSGEYLFQELHSLLQERIEPTLKFMTEFLALQGEKEGVLNFATGAAVTEMKMALTSFECVHFIDALNNLNAALGVEKEVFYKDLQNLHELIKMLAFTISTEQIRKITKEYTSSVQV